MRHFDLCVIGSGPGGQKAAIQAAKLGKKVCVVEAQEVVGGVAVNTGTIPSKALREMVLKIGGAASVAPQVKDFIAAARHTGTLRHLWVTYQEVIQHEIELVRDHFSSNGIALVHGRASFVDPHTVEALGAQGGETLCADFFVIAVGTTPAKPEGVPFDEENIITSDELLRLPKLPHSLIVVGGGVIGTEYASMIATLGVQVTLIEGRDRLLDFADAEITEALQYHLRQNGMILRLGEKVERIERVAPAAGTTSCDGWVAEAVLESGKRLRADALLYCIGRQGATGDLNLAAIGLEADHRGRLTVDASYRTKVPHVFAVGDVIGFPALASTSMEQGRVAARHMFGEPCGTAFDLLPYGIYSIPEISMVGRTEERLTKEGVAYESGVAQYREIARGQLLGDEIGMLKLLIDVNTKEILGVHVIGTGATELIHIGQAVMTLHGTVDYFADAVFNYPTLAECYKVAALNGLNKLRALGNA
jgi:NAD(P) transhydrogenase